MKSMNVREVYNPWSGPIGMTARVPREITTARAMHALQGALINNSSYG
jgi:hypothetical protein